MNCWISGKNFRREIHIKKEKMEQVIFCTTGDGDDRITFLQAVAGKVRKKKIGNRAWHGHYQEYCGYDGWNY